MGKVSQIDGLVENYGCRFYKYDVLARIKEPLLDFVIPLIKYLFIKNVC